jgi:glyoxylase-like metal-dependent hydrolase (beta-lactamase superfamily II)
MNVLEIADGLWRWTAWHEEWKQDVGCVYAETEGGVVLIDPLVPPEEPERFWRALDRDVKRAGGEVHVLITIFWHVRSAVEILARYKARLWAPSRARAAIERRAHGVTDVFRPGDPLPGGTEAFATARSTEVVYWVPTHKSVVPGDVILGADDGAIRMCPESWLPESVGHVALRESLRPLADLPAERVLVSHGEPVLRHGRRALERLVGA